MTPFTRMFELSRTTAEPTLDERLDRIERLRAAVSDNEARFQAVISATSAIAALSKP